MAQADYDIANQSGSAFRVELNSTLSAILSLNSGGTAPTTTVAYSLWADTTTGLLKIRDSSNSSFITVGALGSVNLGLASLAGATMTGAFAATAGSVASPGITFSGDLDTGLFRSDSNKLNIATNGVERAEFGPTEVVFNDTTVDYDFRIKGDNNANLFFVDASTDRIGIGTSAPASPLQVTLSTASATTGNIYVSPVVAGQARYHLYNQGSVAEWIFGQKTSTDHSFKLSKLVSGNELDYLELTTVGILKFDSGYGSAAPAYGCRAWVNFNGTGTVAIRGSGNVSSITDNGTGDYTVNFTTAMVDANYAAFVGGIEDNAGGAAGNVLTRFHRTLPLTTSVRISSNTDGGSAFDMLYFFVSIFR
jgi:hypothetical protein